MTDLLTLLVALCFVELVHNAIEVWGMHQKVQWLSASLRSRPHGKWPVNIDTKLKTLLLHLFILLVIGSLAYSLLVAMALSDRELVTTGLAVLLINYATTTWLVDRFHSAIGRLIKAVKTAGRHENS